MTVDSPPDTGPPTDLDRVLAMLPPAEAERLRRTWDAAAHAAPEDAPDPEAVRRIERFLTTLASPSARRDRPALGGATPARRLRRPWLLGSLGTAVLVLLAAALWVRQPVVAAAGPGERPVLHLPDGSSVTLNSGSTLRRARRFGAIRAVELEGEAFFDVAEASAPFVVRTFDAEVTVLGTTFGVRAWPDDPDAATTVTLVSGRVRLAATERPREPIVLAPGQTVRVSEPTAISTTAAVEEQLAWRTGDFIYKDRPLGLVLNDLERRFGARVTPQPSALRQRRVSVALRNPASAEAVVRDLALALGLRFRARAGGFDLYPPSRP